MNGCVLKNSTADDCDLENIRRKGGANIMMPEFTVGGFLPL